MVLDKAKYGQVLSSTYKTKSSYTYM